jgi:hypothetical protein
VFDGTNTPQITDTAASVIGTGATPSFTVDGTTTVGLKVTSGANFVFKGLIKLF